MGFRNGRLSVLILGGGDDECRSRIVMELYEMEVNVVCGFLWVSISLNFLCEFGSILLWDKYLILLK